MDDSTARDLRRLRRGAASDIQSIVGCDKAVISKQDEALKAAHGVIEGKQWVIDAQNATIQALKDEIVLHKKDLQEIGHAYVVRGRLLKRQRPLLTRARHLEVHALHRSLGRPPIPGAKLPEVTPSEQAFWRDMDWCLVGAEKKEVEDLEHHFDLDARFINDDRKPDIDAFINGADIPPPMKLEEVDPWGVSTTTG